MQKKKILVVDDDPSICKAVRLIFEKEGFDVLETQTLTECLKILKNEKPDVVLLDILMPKMIGTWALKSIKESFPKAKVIMLTVIGTDFHKQMSKKLGAADYITKPFDNEDLVRRVKKAIGK